MTPSLPSELLSHILDLASQNSPALKRRKLRDAFRLVCRSWYAASDRWADVIILDSAELARVIARLGRAGRSSAPAGAGQGQASTVKSVYVRLPPVGPGKGKPHPGARNVNKLLKALTTVRELELEVGTGALGEGGSFWEDAELAAVAPRTLANLTELRTVALTGLPGHTGLELKPASIRRFVANCPTIHSFALKRVDVLYHEDDFDLDSHNLIPEDTQITSLTLDNVRLITRDGPTRFVPSIPAEVTRLSLIGKRIYADGHRFTRALEDALLTRRATLEELSLLEPQRGNYSFPGGRGYGFQLGLSRLVNLRKLAMSPAATTALVRTFAQLNRLEDLSIVQGRVAPSGPLEAAEVEGVMQNRALPLRRVAVSEEIVEGWTTAERGRVEAAAARRGIAFVKL